MVQIVVSQIGKIKGLRYYWAKSKAHPSLHNSLILLFLVALAFIIYSPTINGPFVFDDTSNILHSPAVRITDLSLTALQNAAFGNLLPHRPVANISFALNYLIDQYDVTGYHIVNILTHALTAFLLFLFIRVTQLIIAGPGEKECSRIVPFVAAIIWLVHPLQSQAVAYIVQRMTSLSSMFYLLSMLLYAYGRLSEVTRNRVLFLLGAAVAAILALSSKETAATLPLFILLYELYFIQNLKWDWFNKRLSVVGLGVGTFMATVIIFLGTNPFARILAGYEGRHFTLLQRVLTELRVVVVYMSQILFPHPSRLSLEHDIPLSFSLLSPATTLYAAVFLATLAGVAIWQAKKEPLLSFAVIWYLGNLIIESSIIGLEIIFEHRNYLPSMFFILLLVIIGDRLIRSNTAKSVLVCMIVLFLSLWTYERSIVWADDEVLIRDCINKAPKKYRMYYNLGTFLSEQARYDEAISTFKQAEQVYPRDTSARNPNILYSNLGNALFHQGRYREASKTYYQALQIDPQDANAYLGLGNCSFIRGNYQEAATHYRKGLLIARDPNLIFPLRCSLAKASKAMGKLQEAAYHYSIALSMHPESPEIRSSISAIRRMISTRK